MLNSVVRVGFAHSNVIKAKSGLIYSSSWSPTDSSLILQVNSSGLMKILDIRLDHASQVGPMFGSRYMWNDFF